MTSITFAIVGIEVGRYLNEPCHLGPRQPRKVRDRIALWIDPYEVGDVGESDISQLGPLQLTLLNRTRNGLRKDVLPG